MCNTPEHRPLIPDPIVPSVAGAQTASTNAADIAYCKALGSRYMALHPGTMLPSGTVSVAVSRCDTDPGGSIKTLEAKLRDTAASCRLANKLQETASSSCLAHKDRHG